MSKRRDRKRRIRKTVLAVGEGHTEIGFLKYLRSLYCSTQNRSTIAPKVIIKNAYGKGPEHIYSTALAERQNKSFDRAFVLLDTDVEWPARLVKDAKKEDINLIGSDPCIEGVFLRILNERVPLTASQCKQAIRKLLGTDLTEPKNYASWCEKQRLDELSRECSMLRTLIQHYQ